jgi:hypothetical protein
MTTKRFRAFGVRDQEYLPTLVFNLQVSFAQQGSSELAELSKGTSIPAAKQPLLLKEDGPLVSGHLLALLVVVADNCPQSFTSPLQ